MRYESYLREQWEGIGSLNITNINLLIRFNKTREIFPSVTRVLSILLKTVATGVSVERMIDIYLRIGKTCVFFKILLILPIRILAIKRETFVISDR